MPEPCRSCERREIDWGGCRCQAFALTGEAGTVDPACALSAEHAAMQALATTESAKAGTGFSYRTRKAGAAVKQVQEGMEGYHRIDRPCHNQQCPTGDCHYSVYTARVAEARSHHQKAVLSHWEQAWVGTELA